MCLTVSPDFDSVGAGSPQNFPKLFSLSFEQKRKCKLNNSVSIHFNSGVSKWGGGDTFTDADTSTATSTCGRSKRETAHGQLLMWSHLLIQQMCAFKVPSLTRFLN